MELEVCWSGASWRQIPPPADLVYLDDREPMAVDRAQPGTYKQILIDSVGTDWMERRAIAYHAVRQGMERKRVGDYLTRLVDDGRLGYKTEHRAREKGHRSTLHFYRRLGFIPPTPDTTAEKEAAFEARVLAMLTGTPQRHKDIAPHCGVDQYRLRKALHRMAADGRIASVIRKVPGQRGPSATYYWRRPVTEAV